MKIVTTQLTISTRGKGLYAFTEQVSAWLERQSASQGILTLFIQHTSASLVIQENADPDVTLDLRDFLSGWRLQMFRPIGIQRRVRTI